MNEIITCSSFFFPRQLMDSSAVPVPCLSHGIKRSIKHPVTSCFLKSSMKTLPLILHSVLFGLVQSASLEVKLTSGTFLGVSTPNGTDQWLGIRYGTPPVGDLRFKAPVAITHLNTTAVQDASTFGNACPQPPSDLGAEQSEDCLFLNVRSCTSSKSWY